jgi:predicted ABC-type ATPase
MPDPKASDQPTCWIIGGPNGAGKTTFALQYLPEVAGCSRFINADLIAAGLSPLAPERELAAASRLFLKEVEAHITARHDFGFETTLAGRGYLRLIRQLRADGWRVELLYLALPSVELSRLRVAERVSHGGHYILAKDIERRFPRSLLDHYSVAVDACQCLINHSQEPELVFEQRGHSRNVVHPGYYQHLIQEAKR